VTVGMEQYLKEVKMYSDFKSPFAFLAFDPAFALEDKYRIRLKWKPFQLRLKGKGERSRYSEYKVKYSYMDARRWANMRGGLMIRGPRPLSSRHSCISRRWKGPHVASVSRQPSSARSASASRLWASSLGGKRWP
jgi:2-hydroxychromene-2-carboxylate isomerase